MTSASRSFIGLFALSTIWFTPLCADASPSPVRPRPGELESRQLEELVELGPERRALVDLALALGRKHRLNRYLYGSADPDKGGFDCSGAMHFILTKAGLEPARSSSAQYDWIDRSGLLTKIPASAISLEDPAFDKLLPGDLVFWSGTYQPTDGRTNKVTHVQMYLGVEKTTDKPVMIGSSDGRSYAGKARCGFGVYDFRVPRQGSKSRIVGYGPPPGLIKTLHAE